MIATDERIASSFLIGDREQRMETPDRLGSCLDGFDENGSAARRARNGRRK